MRWVDPLVTHKKTFGMPSIPVKTYRIARTLRRMY